MKYNLKDIVKIIRQKKIKKKKVTLVISLFLLPLVFVLAHYLGRLTEGEKQLIDSYIMPYIFISIAMANTFLTFLRYYNQLKVRNWDVVQCFIIDKTCLKEFETAGYYMSSLKYVYPLVVFEYNYRNEQYISYKIFNGSDWTLFEKASIGLLNNYDIGKSYNCFVNPNNPEFAVLESGLHLNDNVFNLGLAVFFFILGLVV